jgi:hypothetical protein
MRSACKHHERPCRKFLHLAAGYRGLRDRITDRHRRLECEEFAVYGAMDMPWAKLVGQVAQAYGK